MDEETLLEADAALDLYHTKIAKAMGKSRKSKGGRK